MPPGVPARSGLPGSIVTIGATKAFPSFLAMASPITASTWLCFPVVRYGPFSSIPPVKISAVVFPSSRASRTSSIVSSSIQTLSSASIGRGKVIMSFAGDSCAPTCVITRTYESITGTEARKNVFTVFPSPIWLGPPQLCFLPCTSWSLNRLPL